MAFLGEETYHDLDLGVPIPNGVENRGISVENSVDVSLANVDIVRPKHKLNDIGLVPLHPTDDVGPRNVVCLISRVALVVGIEARWFLAVAWEVVHGTNEIHVARQACGNKLIPDQGPPTCNFRYRITEQH